MLPEGFPFHQFNFHSLTSDPIQTYWQYLLIWYLNHVSWDSYSNNFDLIIFKFADNIYWLNILTKIDIQIALDSLILLPSILFEKYEINNFLIWSSSYLLTIFFWHDILTKFDFQLNCPRHSWITALDFVEFVYKFDCKILPEKTFKESAPHLILTFFTNSGPILHLYECWKEHILVFTHG